MMAFAMAGMATEMPAPITTSPSSMPPYESPPSRAIAARPAARHDMPVAIVAGVPSFGRMRAPTPVRLRATTVRAMGAVRRPASRAP